MNAARERSLHSKLLCTFSAEVTEHAAAPRRPGGDGKLFKQHEGRFAKTTLPPDTLTLTADKSRPLEAL